MTLGTWSYLKRGFLSECGSIRLRKTGSIMERAGNRAAAIPEADAVVGVHAISLE